MVADSNYYQILGVSTKASNRDLTVAYRKLALKHHPDRFHSRNNSVEFYQINEAYRVLKTPSLRMRYDQLLNHTTSDYSSQGKEGLFHNLMKSLVDLRERSLVELKKLSHKISVSNSQKVYSDLELSRSLAEVGGVQDFSFQLINQDRSGKEIHRDKQLRITIPARVKDGTILHLKGFKDEAVDEILFRVKVIN